MVQAVKGVFIKCDLQTKVFIQNLDDNKTSSEKIIIPKPGLDDQTVFINAKYLQFIKDELTKHKQAITYQAPVDRKF